ncbi:MAG: sugar ABC transporter substrate-binding protein, partial [Actinomyces sp.]
MKHMRKLLKLLALTLAIAMIAAACGDDDSTSDNAGSDTGTETGDTGSSDNVDATQGGDYTFYVITHGDGGVFWSVAQKGAEDAGRDLGVEVIYQGSNNDPEKQAQDIEAAVAAGADGIAVSLASPDAVGPAVKAAVDAGIPVITLNSGVNQFKELGAITHVGQTEIVAGEGAGERFNNLGATKVLCARQEQSNVGLEERCQGLSNTFNGDVVSEFIGGDNEPDVQEQNIAAILQADPDIDAV